MPPSTPPPRTTLALGALREAVATLGPFHASLASGKLGARALVDALPGVLAATAAVPDAIATILADTLGSEPDGRFGVPFATRARERLLAFEAASGATAAAPNDARSRLRLEAATLAALTELGAGAEALELLASASVSSIVEVTVRDLVRDVVSHRGPRSGDAGRAVPLAIRVAAPDAVVALSPRVVSRALVVAACALHADQPSPLALEIEAAPDGRTRFHLHRGSVAEPAHALATARVTDLSLVAAEIACAIVAGDLDGSTPDALVALWPTL